MRLIYELIRLVFTGIVALVCLMMAISSITTKQNAEASAKWPAAHGTILRTSIEEHMVSRSKAYKPHVDYEFKVGKKEYKGNLLTDPEPDCDTQAEAEIMLRKYPKKSKVVVYYDPTDPSLSRLIKGETSETQSFLWIGLAAFALSVWFLIMRINNIRKIIGAGVGR